MILKTRKITTNGITFGFVYIDILKTQICYMILLINDRWFYRLDDDDIDDSMDKRKNSCIILENNKYSLSLLSWILFKQLKCFKGIWYIFMKM